MRAFVQKLRHIFLPALAISVGFTLGYSLLAWALVYRTRLLPIDEDAVVYVLPFVLAWIPALRWTGPRLEVLRTELLPDRFAGLPLLLAVATMVAPTIGAQVVLSKAGAGVTRLGEMTDIKRERLTKYCIVERPCLQRAAARTRWSEARTGRRGDWVTFTWLVAVPFCAATPDAPPPAWLGLGYEKSIEAWRLGDDEERQREANAYLEEARRSFDRRDLRSFAYLELVASGPARRTFAAVVGEASQAAGPPLVFRAHGDSYEERAGDLRHALALFGATTALFLALVSMSDLHEGRLRWLVEGSLSSPLRTSRLRRVLLPTRATYGVLTLVYANVGVFAAMVLVGLGGIAFAVDDLVAWGALSRPLLSGAGALRLVSCQFLHAGVLHLAANLYGLLIAGLLLEPVIGGRRLLSGYLATGVVASLASVAVHPATVAVGASGAVFGLFGVLLGLLLVRDPRLAAVRSPLLFHTALYVALNLLVGAANPRVDNAAHVGGLVAGLLMAPLIGRAGAWRRG